MAKAELTQLKIEYPGLVKETLPNGKLRFRVRVEGSPNRKITIKADPAHNQFQEHYNSARIGIQLPAPSDARPQYVEKSISWLAEAHLDYVNKEVANGLKSPITLKEKIKLYNRLKNYCGEYNVDMPRSEVIRIRDDMAGTPAYADKMMQCIRVLFDWGMERDYCGANPATGIKNIDRGKGGAVVWTRAEVSRYLKHHEAGTAAHTTMMILLCTACRIGDAISLGRDNEFVGDDGVRYLGWQPAKKGSTYVEIPMVPSLHEATRASKIQGGTYLLNKYGRPMKTAGVLGQMFKRWNHQAGIEGKTAHGIRKSVATILADMGFSQYHVMSVLSHTEAQTSEIYTKQVNRRDLAREAMSEFAKIDWNVDHK